MAKIVLISNYLNHYQLPFSLKMCELTNDNFYFVSQKAISEKRISLGFRNLSDENDFVVKTYEGEAEKNRAHKIIMDADYAIFGGNSRLDEYVIDRIKQNKMTFEYSERLNKRVPSKTLWVKKYINMLIHRVVHKNKPLYLLCTGAYVAGDFNEFNMYQNKAYKWGYFPKFIEHDINEMIENKQNDYVTLVWAGRMIDWKHPDDVIKLAINLKDEGYKFKIKLVGNGELEDNLKEMINDNNLQDCVVMTGSMPPEKVREQMETSNIYLFTSDYQEGWGVVLNEAMNSGCACVASHAPGSTGYLIDHMKNGIIYESGNFEDLYSKVKMLIENREMRNELGINAYNTIKNTWNADVAAERFLVLAKELGEGNDTPFNNGPCSKAEPLSNDKMFKRLVEND